MMDMWGYKEDKVVLEMHKVMKIILIGTCTRLERGGGDEVCVGVCFTSTLSRIQRIKIMLEPATWYTCGKKLTCGQISRV